MAELTQKQRTGRQSRALIAAFFAAYFFSYGLVHPILGPDTAYTLLADLVLVLSLSGNVIQLPMIHIMALALGLALTCMAFATFASYGRYGALSLMGAVGLGLYLSFVADRQTAVTLAVLLSLLALLHHWLDHLADCQHMLLLSTLLMVAVILASLGASLLRHGEVLTPDALRAGVAATAAQLKAQYEALAPNLEQLGALRQLPVYNAPLRTDQAVRYVVNYLPMVVGIGAMLTAFFFTAWFRRASGRQLPRIGLVIEEFEVTQVAALLFLGASLLAFLGKDFVGLVAFQYLTVMTLPLSLQGLSGIRRNTRETGRALPILLLLLLFFTATPGSILLFFALIGALDRLVMRRKAPVDE